jgi:Sec-independent protein translocase protein TatA
MSFFFVFLSSPCQHLMGTQFTILLVGYFVLGPSDLYKLVKEIGTFVQNFRTFTTEATANLENTFESQLQLEEIRKAQRELNEAFSFRRSINVDSDTDPFEVNAKSPRLEEPATVKAATSMAAAAAATAEGAVGGDAVTSPPKKKIRRRVKKKVDVDNIDEVTTTAATADLTDTTLQELANNVPDLNMDDEDDFELAQMQDRAAESMRLAQEELKKEKEEEEERARVRSERLERLEGNQKPSDLSSSSPVVNGSSDKDPQIEIAQQSRFQQQLSGNWNDQILQSGDKLEPLASIMDRLALLEDEKAAADRRLQEEFKLREENEERYYREKRALLEEAAAKIQADAYNLSEITSKDAVTGK